MIDRWRHPSVGQSAVERKKDMYLNSRKFWVYSVEEDKAYEVARITPYDGSGVMEIHLDNIFNEDDGEILSWVYFVESLTDCIDDHGYTRFNTKGELMKYLTALSRYDRTELLDYLNA